MEVLSLLLLPGAYPVVTVWYWFVATNDDTQGRPYPRALICSMWPRSRGMTTESCLSSEGQTNENTLELQVVAPAAPFVIPNWGRTVLSGTRY